MTQTLLGLKHNLFSAWRTFQSERTLQKRLDVLETKLIHFEEMERENERLKKLLDFKATMPKSTRAVRVIGQDLLPWRKTLILDKGSQHGIKKNMAALVERGLAGRIFEVGPLVSRALLLIDPDSRVSGITEVSRAQGVVAGDGSETLTMLYLELDAEIAVGEIVLTSGIGESYPKGIGIGTITSIEKDSSGLHLAAKVKPFAEFSKLEELLCIEYFPSK